MRFRTKFGTAAYAHDSLALIAAAAWFGGLHSWWLGAIAVGLNVGALSGLFYHAFVWWDVDATCVRARYFLSIREVACKEVTHVGGWNAKDPSSRYVAIGYCRPAPLPDFGQIVAHPGDREQFIATLRRCAPQAAFDV
jgi:hypothetical protein